MAGDHREKPHRTRRKTRHSLRESEEISRAVVFKPRPRRNAVQQPGTRSQGPAIGATERERPRKKADVKAEHSSKLLGDVKGSVACGVDAVGEGWQSEGAGERVKDRQSLRVDATLLPREIRVTQML